MRNTDTTENQNMAIRVFNLFVETAHSVMREADRQLYKAAGLSAGKFTVLIVLSVNGGAMTAAKLAKGTNTRPHNITTLVDRMKKDGLLTTERNESDRRSVRIRLTDKGRAVLAQALPAAREIVARLTASMSKQELAASEKLLTKVKQNIYRGSSK
jgi:DNA-binding MarR family transcriptional regulator